MMDMDITQVLDLDVIKERVMNLTFKCQMVPLSQKVSSGCHESQSSIWQSLKNCDILVITLKNCDILLIILKNCDNFVE